MYIQITKTEVWHETYVTTMSDDNTSLVCKPCSYDSFAEYKDHFKDLPGYFIEDIDENNYNIREKK